MTDNAATRPKRNIVILSDGTGNSRSSPFKTNVWRTYQYLDLANEKQIACYDDGVGSASNAALRILGGALGFGLKRNVIDLHLFLSRNYRAGDDLYFFGFSRGAFTIHVLIGLIRLQGLLAVSDSDGELMLRRRANWMYNYFRPKAFSRKEAPWLTRFVRAAFDLFSLRALPPEFRDYKELDVEGIKRKVTGVKFIGLWDPVDAHGLPIEELRSGIDRTVFPMSFRSKDLWEDVGRACHALALDDPPTTFHRVLWEEGDKSASPEQKSSPERERITQLWFAGVHADVGGGYPELSG